MRSPTHVEIFRTVKNSISMHLLFAVSSTYVGSATLVCTSFLYFFLLFLVLKWKCVTGNVLSVTSVTLRSKMPVKPACLKALAQQVVMR